MVAYFSENNVLDGSDLPVGDRHIDDLKNGKDRLVPVQIELPDDAETCPAFLIVKVDGDEDISESNEDNDGKSESITVIEWTDNFKN